MLKRKGQENIKSDVLKKIEKKHMENEKKIRKKTEIMLKTYSKLQFNDLTRRRKVDVKKNI